jgi:hypothetical protein
MAPIREERRLDEEWKRRKGIEFRVEHEKVKICEGERTELKIRVL